MTSFLLGIAFLLSWLNFEHQKETDNQLSLLFIGDIMGHGPQIKAAFNDSTKTYSYNSMFKYINKEVEAADFTIANLEVTLAGKPLSRIPSIQLSRCTRISL
jgi:Bacterial capsule synthesis protein PGA_cap.